MRNGLFKFLCVIWFVDMAAMVEVAPLGEHMAWFAGLYCIGHILMISLVRKFPAGLKPSTSLTIIFIIGVAARLLFLSYPVGNDIF